MENQENKPAPADNSSQRPPTQQRPESSQAREEEREEMVQAEIGPEIYDLGQGGPDASSSGLRNEQDEQQRQTGSEDGDTDTGAGAANAD
jgi:hypothetical protein